MRRVYLVSLTEEEQSLPKSCGIWVEIQADAMARWEDVGRRIFEPAWSVLRNAMGGEQADG